MRKGISSLVIVGVAACAALYALTAAPSATQLSSSAVELDFMSFVSKYGKSYATKEEFEFRLDLFRSTLSKIRQENSKNGNTFTLAINKFADWTPQEFKRMLSLKKTTPGQPLEFNENVSIPNSVDWRTAGAVNTV